MSNLKAVSFFLFLLFFITGCARFSKNESEAQVLEPASISEPIGQAFSEGEWPSDEWWHLFHDQELTELIELALMQNPDLQAMRARAMTLFEESGVVKAPLYPHLNFEAFDHYFHLSKYSIDRYPPSFIPAVLNQTDLRFNFDWELDFFGKLRHQYNAALYEAFAARAENCLTKLMVTTLIATSYLDLKWLIIQKKLVEKMIGIRTLNNNLVKLGYNNGIENEMALLQDEVQLLHLDRRLKEIEGEIINKRHELRVLVGEGPESDIELKEPKAEFSKPFPLPEDLSSGLIARRPDIQAKIWLMEAASEEIGAAKAAFYPNVNLLAFAGLESLTWSKFFTLPSFMGDLAGFLSLPIFTGGRLRSNLRAKCAAFDQAIYEYNSMILQAAQEVADGITTQVSLDKQYAVQDKVLKDSLEELKLMNLRFDKGVSSSFGPLFAAQRAVQEELNLKQIDYLKQYNTIRLIKALGGGYGN